jgi:hypothetical protein
MDQSLHSHQLAINHGKEFKVAPSACKVLAIVLRGSSVVSPVDILEHGLTFPPEYCAALKSLREANNRKCPSILRDAVILLHDDASCARQENLETWSKISVWQLWTIRHTARIWRTAIFTFFSPLMSTSQDISTRNEDVKRATTKQLS